MPPIDSPAGQTSALQSLARQHGGFVAGTLVHTSTGPIPIEQVRVGDEVLSPSEGQGDLRPRRVVGTARFDEQKVLSLLMYDVDDLDRLIGLVATGSQPFWVEGTGWARCDQLTSADAVELAHRRQGAVIGVRPVFRTAQAGVGWVPAPLAGHGREFWELGGLTIAFDQGETQPVDYRAELVPFPGDFLGLHEESSLLRAPVYDIEVEGHQGFFVGTKGVRARHAG